MRRIFIFILLFIVFNSKGQDKIVKFYKSDKLNETILTLYSDKKYKIIFPFAADLPDSWTKDDDVVLSAGYWIQKSDTVLLVDTIKQKKHINKRYKLIKIDENNFINLTVEFFEKSDRLKMYAFTNLTRNWTFNGEIKYGLMNGDKIDLKNWMRYRIVNGIVTDSIKIKKIRQNKD